jgi:hypothetical protein
MTPVSLLAFSFMTVPESQTCVDRGGDGIDDRRCEFAPETLRSHREAQVRTHDDNCIRTRGINVTNHVFDTILAYVRISRVDGKIETTRGDDLEP